MALVKLMLTIFLMIHTHERYRLTNGLVIKKSKYDFNNNDDNDVERKKGKKHKMIQLEAWDEIQEDSDFSLYGEQLSKRSVFNEKFNKTCLIMDGEIDYSTRQVENILNTIAAMKEESGKEDIDYELEWEELKRELIITYEENNGIIVFNEITSSWTFCAWTTRWTSYSDILSSWFSTSSNHFRVCCNYHLLGLAKIRRKALPYKDYIPLSFVRQFNNKMDDLILTDLEYSNPAFMDGNRNYNYHEEWGSEEDGEYLTEKWGGISGRNSKDMLSEDTVTIDLMEQDYASGSYVKNCVSNNAMSLQCRVSCCLSYYTKSPMCKSSSMNCYTPFISRNNLREYIRQWET